MDLDSSCSTLSLLSSSSEVSSNFGVYAQEYKIVLGVLIVVIVLVLSISILAIMSRPSCGQLKERYFVGGEEEKPKSVFHKIKLAFSNK